MLSFIKKNKFFVLLCTAFIVIIISLGGYFLLNQKEPEKPVHKPQPPVQDPVEEEVVDFTNFSGEYNRKTPQITVRWELSSTKEVASIKLYYIQNKGTDEESENEIADVTDTSSYTMPQGVYEFPTGSNTFKIKATLQNGEVVEAQVSVNVSLIISAQQEVKVNQKEHSADITLTYVYGEDNPVDIPTIRVLDTTAFTNENITVIDTKKEEKDGFITAKTTYHFTWYTEELPQPFTLRWYFEQIKRNYDFLVDLSAAS